MGSKALVYKSRVLENIDECQQHFKRLTDAFCQIEKRYSFPISKANFESIVESVEYLAYSDQIIYRFSKLQDSMGAKLFKSVLLYQGENVNKPFLDILNRLEAMDIVDVDEWFEIRDLRNEIAHDYESRDGVAKDVLNTIFKLRIELEKILLGIENLIKASEK